MMHEYIIIGAGPAGLQLAYHLQQAGRDYVVLEAAETPGAFFKEFPRHRQLISINKVYTGYDDVEINMRWDWNSLLSDDDAPLLFKQFSKDYFPDANAMIDYLTEYARQKKLNIVFNSRVESIHKGQEGDFQITCESGATHRAPVVIVATGTPLANLPTTIPGFEQIECYNTVSVDPNDFAGQRVLILGKGNSAFETADNLIGTTSLIHIASPDTVRLAWQTHFVGHLRAVNNNFLDTYQLKSQNAVLDATIDYILKEDDKYHVGIRYTNVDEQEEIVYDRVIACTGFRFDASIFDDSCRPELTIEDRFPRQTSSWESTNVANLYFAGSLMQARDFKKTQSAFVHGFRYNVRLLSRLLLEKHHQIPLARKRLRKDPTEIASNIIDRVNQNSGLWQQNGFLCDVVLLNEHDAEYYEELSCDHVMDRWGRERCDMFVVTMNFGLDKIKKVPNVFAIPRPNKDDVSRAEESAALHPIVQHYRNGHLISTHHVIEDLRAEWKEAKHIDPLIDFLRSEVFPVKKPKMNSAVRASADAFDQLSCDQ